MKSFRMYLLFHPKVGDSRQWIVSGGDKDGPFVGSDGESDSLTRVLRAAIRPWVLRPMRRTCLVWPVRPLPWLLGRRYCSPCEASVIQVFTFSCALCKVSRFCQRVFSLCRLLWFPLIQRAYPGH